jgi:hypothetical protein
LDLFLAFKERLEFAKEYFSDSTDICSKHLFEHGITVYNKLLINGTELVIKETELAKVFDYLSLNRKLAYQSHHLALKKKVQVWLICHLRNFYNCSYKALGTMISLARKIRKHYSVPI